jgi:hypothetical protein
MKKEVLNFRYDGKLVNFTVYHNLPKTFGLNFDNAVANWIVRTKHLTALSLCNYIMSKGTGYSCMTEEMFLTNKKNKHVS